MPELGSLGSVRGAFSNERPYREYWHQAERAGGGNRMQRGMKSTGAARKAEGLLWLGLQS